MEKIAEEIQNENIGFVLSQNDNAQVTPGIENENYQSVPINTKSDLNKTAYNGANTKTKPFRPQVSNTQINSTKLTGITPTERLTRGKRKKKLIPAGKRNELRKESCSPKDASGTFVAATQKFGAVTGADPYRFTSTQSQNPEEHPRTPVSSRKRSRRLLHKKSGLKKLKIDASAPQTSRHQITSPVLTSQSSDVSVTTIGSLSSIPSSISQSSPRRETTLLLSSGSSRQSVTDEITTRLSGKRLSIEQSLPDTLPLPHSEEENYQQVHVVIEKVERVYREITTTRRVISLDGQVLDCTKEVKRLDPVVVEETTHKKVQYLYLPSPSRSGQSMTSGDLGDISSSLSKSSVSSGSLGSKVSLTSPSLDHAGSLNPLSNHLDMQGYGDKGQSRSQRRESLEEIKKEQPIQKTSNTMEAPKLVPAKHPSLSTHEAPKRTSTSSKSSSHPTTPEVPASKSVTPVVQSDQDSSGVGTPLGSTINKTGSYLHSRTVSIESPRTVSMNSPRTANINSPHTVSVNNPVTASMNSPHTSESLFSSSSDDNRKKLEASKSLSDKDPSKSVDTETASTSKAGYNESKQISEVSPQQDQAVSSSGTPPDTVTMVTSSGDTGCRVLAKWKDGFFYPGCLKSTPDRYTKCSVKFDDGDRMNVRSCDILLIERLAPGQSVMVLTPAGDFEYGLVLQQHSDGYVVETDDSKAGRYSFSQVILSTDQAACIVSDMGSVVLIQGSTNPGAPRDVGQVSLENIVDTPRRSAKKKPPEEVKKEDTEVKGQGQTTRGLKRKLDSLQPQATSTPTPKGKGPLSLSKQQKVSVTPSPSTSPIRGIQDSPRVAATSPRKTRVGLFPTGLGPLPGARLFEGIHFLLTHVEKTPQQVAEEKEALKPALDTSTDESSADEEPCTPFNKDHLKTQIEAGGGVVVEDLTEELMSSGRRVVLLSSTYQRTLKYLQCLAGGVPCISHMWVVDSCTAQELLNETIYLLPAGISLEKHRLMEWNKRNDVFIGIKAVVHSKNTRFVDSWSAILKLGKCQVYPQQQLTDVHVMVTDSTCSPALERQARKKEVPLVSTEWVIQSLINGKVAGYDVHPKYRHDFSV
ncbi:hypothetical protein DPMN_110448 [Dreissena polymorpha]|uniref:BRCT domain-containing protein n=2 Tax=Dreissena polymorpha TaxID=45954 RepID=A0A9D4KCL6_DREPO|nr:hypothetical protein DPMN_110448 [Dreissena polymorpha]